MANFHTTLGELFSDIADAIREKTGDDGLLVADNFPAAIALIPTGGSTHENGVVFLDIDGSEVEYWEPSDVSEKTALPALPTHSGLTVVEWTINNIEFLQNPTDYGIDYSSQPLHVLPVVRYVYDIKLLNQRTSMHATPSINGITITNGAQVRVNAPTSGRRVTFTFGSLSARNYSRLVKVSSNYNTQVIIDKTQTQRTYTYTVSRDILLLPYIDYEPQGGSVFADVIYTWIIFER